MREKKFGIITIITIVLAVVLILFTKTDILANTGLAIATLNEEQTEVLIEEIEDGKRLVVFNGVSSSDFNHFIDMVFDSPELFWVDMQYQALSIGDISVLFLNEKYKDIDEKTNEIDNKVQSVIDSIITNNMTEYEKILTIHDWICENVSYDVLDNNGDQDIYGALFSNTARCAGYAKLFTVLLEKAGIQSEVISGNAIDESGNIIAHAWNLVYIDGDAYYFDITWNDNDGGETTYNWFGVTTNEFKEKHFPNEGYDWIETEATDACYYIKNGMYIKEYSASAIVRQIQKQGKEFTIKCKNQTVLNDTIKALSDSEELQKIMRGTGITYIDQIAYEEDDAVNCIKIIIE